jgi:hypothetical protein
MGQRRIRMRTLYATEHRSIAPGQAAMVDQAEAEQLVAGGYAVFVSETGVDELPRRTTPGKTGGRAPASTSRDSGPDHGGEPPAGAAAAKVLEWVGTDRDRAARALEAERGQGDKARKSLVDALQRIVGTDGQE